MHVPEVTIAFDRDVDKTLSTKTSDLYKAIEETAEQIDAKEKFLDQLRETDVQLTGIYSDIFSVICINDVTYFE